MAAQIKQWASAAYASRPDARFSVNEIICRDPSCPGAETIILVMIPGLKTLALKITGAMADVGEQDVADAACKAADKS